MFKKIYCLFLAFIPITTNADDCIKYKLTPTVDIITPSFNKNIIQPNEPMNKFHGNVVATLIEDYDLVVDIFSTDGGYCVVLKNIDGTIGYNDFLIKIDNSNRYGSCAYDAILNHENKHIDAYLSVIKDLDFDIKSSVFNAANSVMPIFISSRDAVDSAIETMNITMREHPELILIKQKIKAAEEIRNKRVDQSETNQELERCYKYN